MKPKDWKAQALPLLGVETDAEIARKLGVTARQVGYLRQQQGKQAACRARWSLEVIKKLSLTPPAALAEQLQISTSTVLARRRAHEMRYERRGLPPEALAMLGKVPDMKVALRFGRSYDTARKWRTDAGLPPVIEWRAWTRQELALLGTMPDNMLARQIARRPRCVRLKREALGIPQHEG